MAARRKALLELEKQRKDLEEDAVIKKARSRIGSVHGRISSIGAKYSF
jgi:hypothetical protein